MYSGWILPQKILAQREGPCSKWRPCMCAWMAFDSAANDQKPWSCCCTAEPCLVRINLSTAVQNIWKKLVYCAFAFFYFKFEAESLETPFTGNGQTFILTLFLECWTLTIPVNGLFLKQMTYRWQGKVGFKKQTWEAVNEHQRVVKVNNGAKTKCKKIN